VLAETGDIGTGVFSRRALAWLAEAELTERRYAHARDRFASFQQRCPDSSYSERHGIVRV
jgi:hypothetical protein